MLADAPSQSLTTGFQSTDFLSAFYGINWRRFQLHSSSNSFEHCPVLSKIDGTSYYYGEAWRGYAEPVLRGDGDYLRLALQEYSRWCRKESIACELIRLDPTGELSQKIPAMDGVALHEGQPVAILNTPLEYGEYFKRLAAPCQRILRAAEKELFAIAVTANDTDVLEEAAALHLRTLQRVGAGSKWIVNASSLKTLARLPNFSCIGVRNKNTGALVSFSGSLCHNDALHVLLIANALGDEGKGASDLNYAEIVRHAVQNRHNIHRIYFGGGRSLDGTDALFRFKLKYSLGNSLRCRYLAIVHDPKAAEDLAQRSTRRPGVSEPLNSVQKNCFPFL